MSQNIEIEFKNMLTKTEYYMLLKEFKINEKKIMVQENHYFDTKNFDLKEKQTALRIRQKKDQFEMTLKQPASIGLLETNQLLTEEEALMAIEKGKLPLGKIADLINQMGLSFSEIIYFGSLTTHRAELNYMNELLVLDHSIYLSKEDFELELEVKEYQNGRKVFTELLNRNGIPERLTDNKIKRFYQQKFAQSE